MLQAGLFSAVASAFIIDINSELKPDSNEETTALLRVLIYKVDNTTFNNAPTVPQWTGPARTTVQVQAILYASLAISLFSAFLAMLGKQWLNRYASADLRGSIIDRCQHRQYKLNGIASWYFENVIELLPVMLQAALLLFGCALSRYLWETNTTIASVIIGVTSFGLFLFISIVVAGAIFPSCPYQTPGARLLRHLPHAPVALLSLFSMLFHSGLYRDVFNIVHLIMPNQVNRILFPFTFTLSLLLALPIWLAMGAIVLPIVSPLVLYSLLCEALEEPQTVPDVNCISWTLRISLHEPTRLSAIKLLATATLQDPNPTLVADCLDVLLRYIKVVDGSAVVVQELEQSARASAVCFLKTLSQLALNRPWSGVFEDLRQPYTRAFPPATNFDNLPFPHILGIIHCIFYPVRAERPPPPVPMQRPLLTARVRRLLLPVHVERRMLSDPTGRLLLQVFDGCLLYLVLTERLFFTPAPVPLLHAEWRSTRASWVQWEGYRPAGDEYEMVAYSLAKFSRLALLRTRPEKVSRWLLRFTFHALSQELMPATPVVVTCLGIIRRDLGGYLSHQEIVDERCVPT